MLVVPSLSFDSLFHHLFGSTTLAMQASDTPLTKAVLEGRFEVAEFLLNSGANKEHQEEVHQ